MRGPHFHAILYLLVLFSSNCLAARKPAPGAPPPAGGGTAEVPPSATAEAAKQLVGEWMDLAPWQGHKYKLTSKVMSHAQALQACHLLSEVWQTNGSTNTPNWMLASVPNKKSKFSEERRHLQNEVRKKEPECVWVYDLVADKGGRKVVVTEIDGIRQFLPFHPSIFSDGNETDAGGNSTKAPAPGKKTKREIKMKGVKLITLVQTQTLFPFIQDVQNDTKECFPGCAAKTCTIERKKDDCNINTQGCSLLSSPKCEILRKSNHKDCTGGCDNCTVATVICYVRTQKCTAFRDKCTVESPNCTVTKESCSISRKPCLSYSKPCTFSAPPEGKDCIAEKPCFKKEGDSYCKVVVDPECTETNRDLCAKVFNCSLDPLCVSPILCRPPIVHCPPLETFCPPPTIKCPAPKVTCTKPKTTCPAPEIICPTPDTVCTRPKVQCSAPVIKCAQVVATCDNPKVNCPAPQVDCKAPRVDCPKTDEDCGVPDIPPNGGWLKCPVEECTTDCQCSRFLKANGYGVQHCACSEQCQTLCRT